MYRGFWLGPLLIAAVAAYLHWIGRATSMLYRFAAALTLDEFALWLNLEDVYWKREGRESYEAMALFGCLLAVGLLGKQFLLRILFMRPRLGDPPRVDSSMIREGGIGESGRRCGQTDIDSGGREGHWLADARNSQRTHAGKQSSAASTRGQR